MRTVAARRPTRPARAVAALAIAGAVALGAVACSSADLQEGGIPTTVVARTEAPSGELPAATRERLQAAVDDVMAAYDVPGAVVGVYVPGEGSWVLEQGVADLDTGEPVSADMAWPLRSVTKSFTVTLVLQLVDEGLLSLDDPVSTYLDGVPNGDEITIRELADMTSGLPEYTTEAFLDDFVADVGREFTLDELNAYAFAAEPQFEPGAERVYTNTNTNVLGAVVESVTGQPFDAVLSERILEPMGLDSAAYLQDGGAWAEPHPTGYEPVDGVQEPEISNFTIFGPAGAMVIGVDDLRAWGEALGSGSLLLPGTQRARLEGGPLDQGPEYDRYALGIGELDGWWGHTGEGLGFTALTMHDPDTGATVVVVMNTAQADDGMHPPTVLFRQLAPIVADLG